MAKKKKNEEFSDSDIDSVFDVMCEEAKQYYGAENVFTGDESERQLLGMYLPALCLRYLFQSNIMPFTRIGQIVGEEGSCKSALLSEFFRITRANRGRSHLMEAETKDSPIMRLSINNYDKKAVLCKPCESMEDWQDGLTYFIDLAKKKMTGTKAAPGIGKIVPVMFGVDSLMGKGCRETIAKIAKEGFAQRSFPAEALLIANYMRFIPQQLANWPFVLWGVNHMKPGTDSMGRPKNNVAGGKSLKFQETYEIEMHRVKDIKKVDVQGIAIKLLMRKNSLGASRLSINADLLWWADEEHDFIQRTVWDWNSASIDLLLSFEGSRYNKLQEVCDLHVVDKSKKLVWSQVLDIPKSDPTSFSKAGEILESKPDVLARLHKLLRVYEYQVFTPGISYEDQLEEARQKAADIDWDERAAAYGRTVVAGTEPEISTEDVE